MPFPTRGSRLAGLRRKSRPLVRLHVDDVAPSTRLRYQKMLDALGVLLSSAGGTSLSALIKEGEFAALQVWLLLFLQIGYDCGTMGLSDAGNLLSAMSRELRLSPWCSQGSLVPPEGVLKPLWKAFAHWKRLEPYDYRLPLTPEVVFALCGVAVDQRDWRFLLFVILSFHCWLRPNECLSLQWSDLCTSPYLGVPGVVSIRCPKVKSPPVQHVVIESVSIAAVVNEVRAQLCHDPLTPVFTWNPAALHRKWVAALACLCLNHDVVKDSRLLSSRFTPAGLRTSGATADFLRNENLDRVMWRGRWHSLPVLKHYLQLGVAHLASMSFSRRTVQLVSIYARLFARFSLELCHTNLCIS